LLYYEDQLVMVADRIIITNNNREDDDDYYQPLLNLVLRSCLGAIKYIGGRMVTPANHGAIVHAALQLRALDVVLEVVTNGSFQGRKVFHTGGLVMRGKCLDTDYCAGRRPASSARSQWQVQKRAWLGLASAQRFNRLAEQRGAASLRVVLDRVFDYVWGPSRLTPRTDENGFDIQRLWASSFVDLARSKNITSVVAANLRLDASKVEEVIGGELVFLAGLVKAHWALVGQDLKDGLTGPAASINNNP
jgi:hypothetical protein